MKLTLPAAAALVALSLPLGALGQTQTGLPERYRKWIGEDVAYIITGHERDVFAKLQTDRERDIFIEAFWKHRDPVPETPQNEFKDEHYRRLNFANANYGRSTPLPGWKTDRGRIFILLGAPQNIEQYSNVNGVYPAEIWFYLGDESLGLPAGFNIIFFKRNGIGDYVLYSPAHDGPGSLLAESMGGYRDVTRATASYSDDMAAYKALQELEPNLARQTLSLIPSEAVRPGYESLASNRLLATIFDLPRKNVSTGYADAILKYKDSIEVEYTANFISSDVLVHVIRDGTGSSLVHYSIEPSRITALEAGGKYEVRFALTGRISDAAGRTVYQFDKEFPLSLTAAELENARATSISIQDAFPLVPGAYNFDILLKNVLSKEFTVADRALVVPEASGPPGLSPLLLAYKTERTPSPPGERVPFKAGDDQLLCQARKTFSAADTLVLFYQINGLTDDIRASGALRTTFYRDDKEFLSRTAKLAADATVLDVQPLATFPPGYYRVGVSLLGGQGAVLAAAKEDFEISLAAAVPRPMVIAKVVPAVRAEDDLLAAGIQHMNEGRFEAAKALLADAHGRAPARPDVAAAYAQVLYRAKDYRLVRDVLLPWSGADDAAAEVLALYGQACHALGDYQEAVAVYARYLARYGAHIDILNYLGTCHFQLGNTAEALKVWEKSLELKPDQPKLRDLVESLKKK